MKLYKYLPPERYDVLETSKIAVTPSTRCNDPFDCNPVLVGDNRPQVIRNALSSDPRGWNSVEDGVSKLGDAEEWERRQALGQKLYQEEWAAKFGILCLSSRWDIIPMWSYYANEHRGLVIEFDADLAGWSSEVRKVNYSKERPKVVVPESSTTADTEREFVAAHWTKAAAWCHEQEWRLLFHLSNCTQRFTRVGEINLTGLRKDAVTALYLGAQMDSRLKAFLQRSLNTWGYGHIRLAEVLADRKRFALVERPLLHTGGIAV